MIEPVSRPIEIAIKILVSLYLFRSVLDWCWISRSIFDWSKTRFDWSKHTEPSQEFLIAISIDWKTNSIDRNTQSQAKNFNRNFDLSKNTFDWSKFWKKQSFENQSKKLQKLLKALNFVNKMHEYEMKCFSKTLVLNPVFPKLRCSNNSP